VSKNLRSLWMVGLGQISGVEPFAVRNFGDAKSKRHPLLAIASGLRRRGELSPHDGQSPGSYCPTSYRQQPSHSDVPTSKSKPFI